MQIGFAALNTASSQHVNNTSQTHLQCLRAGQSRRCSWAANRDHMLAFSKTVTGTETGNAEDSFQQFRIDSLLSEIFVQLVFLKIWPCLARESNSLKVISQNA